MTRTARLNPLPHLHQNILLYPLEHITVAIFHFFAKPGATNFLSKQRCHFSYSVHAGQRHFGPVFSYDVSGVFDVEGFPNFLLTGSVFVIGRMNKFTKCLPVVIIINCSNCCFMSHGMISLGSNQHDKFLISLFRPSSVPQFAMPVDY